MTKDQIRSALMKVPSVEMSTGDVRRTFQSGKKTREWAQEHGLVVESRKGGVTIRAK